MPRTRDDYRTGTGVRLHLVGTGSHARPRPTTVARSVALRGERETAAQSAIRLVMFLVTAAIVVFAAYQL